MNRRHIAAAAAAVVLLIMAVPLVVHTTASPGAGADAPLPPASASTSADAPSDGTQTSDPDGAASPPHHGRPGAVPVVADRALARAYAAAGLAEGGDATVLDHLDDAARERLDEARALLKDATLVRHAAAGVIGAAGPMPGSGAGPRPAAGPDLPADALRLDLPAAVAPSEALRETPNGPLLVEPGLWAKASYDPDRQRQLVVTDGCNGGYAIAIYAQDFSTIRLDGGLVVPGRYYEVDGSSVITGASAASVDIRPLSALTVYATAPARPPQSNG